MILLLKILGSVCLIAIAFVIFMGCAVLTIELLYTIIDTIDDIKNIFKD